MLLKRDHMPKHLSVQQIEGYQQNQLSATELLALDTHIMICAACRERLFEPEKQQQAWQTFIEDIKTTTDSEDFHLCKETISDFINNLLDEEEHQIVQEHIETCDNCKQETQQLAEFLKSPATSQNSGDLIEQYFESNEFESLPSNYREIIKHVVAEQSLEMPGLMALRGYREIPVNDSDFGDESTSNLVSPIDVVVWSLQPTLRWQVVQEAITYQVEVYQSDTSARIVASKFLKETNWQLSLPLQRGNSYYWRLWVTKENQRISIPQPPTPAPQFKVLEQNKVEQLNEAKKLLSDFPLLLGILYAHAGLLEEAELELTKSINNNQELQLAKKLLQSLHLYR